MGSVKDLEIIKKPFKNKMGIGRFYFSDRYSVFDWGKMPDEIKEKGKSLCIVGAYFFEKLEAYGIKSHYKGVLQDGKLLKLKDLSLPSSVMEIDLVRVIKPEAKNGKYSYENLKKESGNFLIPLEIIFRNYLPANSSFVKRIKEGKILLSDYGLSQIPPEDFKLEKPIIDFSTKLEPTDRYLNEKEAFEISGLNEKEFEELKRIALLVNEVISKEAEKIGLIHIDGKMEAAIDDKKRIILIDVIGTLDECRYFKENFHLSKEIARIFYRRTKWYEEIEEAKKIDRENWKTKVNLEPPNLPAELKEAISDMYCSFCNELTGREWFKDMPPLKEVIKRLREIKFD